MREFDTPNSTSIQLPTSSQHTASPLYSLLASNDSHFTVVSYNICGLNNTHHRAELNMFLSRTLPSVVIIQEPKIDHRINKTPPAFYYHTIYFKHPTKATGIVMYIHNSCTFKQITDIPHCSPYRPAHTSTTVAWVWVSSPCLTTPVIIGGAYLGHDTNEQDIISLATNIHNASTLLLHSSTSLPIFLLGECTTSIMGCDG